MSYYIIVIHPQTNKPMGFIYEEDNNEIPIEFPTKQAARELMKEHIMKNHYKILEF